MLKPTPQPTKVSIDLILVSKDRVRKNFSSVKELADSMSRLGMLNPIVVAPCPDRPGYYQLLAGESRYRAAMYLQWAEVPITTIDSLSPLERRLVELEENTRRKDLDWTEQVEATRVIDQIKRELHGTAWSLDDTAKVLGMSKTTVGRDIQIAEQLVARPDLKKKLSTMPKLVALRELERISKLESAPTSRPSADLILGSCLDHLPSLPSESVHLILSDPPYGIEAVNDNTLQPYTANLAPTDNLSPDDINPLMSRLFPEIARLLVPGGHFYLFFSLDFYESLRQLSLANNLEFHSVPLIWRKNITTAAFNGYNYLPCYEVIFFGWKPPKTRKLDKPCRAILDFSVVPPEHREHPFHKPPELLELLITQSTTSGELVLDPFAGSGSTLITAQSLGRRVLGYEINPQHHALAARKLGAVQA